MGNARFGRFAGMRTEGVFAFPPKSPGREKEIMSDMSTQWDKQWSELLTRCHGRDIEADAGFKAGLLGELKRKTADHALPAAPVTALDDDAKWGALLKTAYTPCRPDAGFKTALLASLKATQVDAARDLPDSGEDLVLRAMLTKSYQPVQPRREFETRLLENLKERQRSTTEIRVHGRRRTLFLSAASSLAAAAAVMFVVWLGPVGNGAVQSAPAGSGDLRLTVPDAVAAAPAERHESALPAKGVMFASFDSAPAGAAVQTAGPQFETAAAMFGDYRAADAFAGAALPASARALRNIEMNSGAGWRTLADAQSVALRPGSVFRAKDGMGHLKFSDGSLVSISPDTLLTATPDGLTVAQGFMLVSVPSSDDSRFRLHFPERDVAVEPGTELAVMVENPDKFAAGGAPAPMVMVVEGDGATGGLALARGKNGIGPLFAKQVYRLDKYVTPDLPGRTLCDTECNDLNKLFKMETVREDGIPLAAFASGGFAAERELSNYSMILTPAGFTKKDGRWVADNYNGEETVKLRYLSDAYFGFANQRRDLARELALGSEVILDGGDGTFYEIVR